MPRWFEIEQAAKLVRLYRLIAATRRKAGEQKLARAAESKARQYEQGLRDLATEMELA